MKYLTLIERFEDFKKQLSYLRVRAPRGPAWRSIFHSRALNAVHDNAVHHCTQVLTHHVKHRGRWSNTRVRGFSLVLLLRGTRGGIDSSKKSLSVLVFYRHLRECVVHSIGVAIGHVIGGI